MISLNHKIDCCICSSGSRAFPAGFVQQNLPRLNFVGSSHFSISLISFFQRRIISPFSGKLCDVSNFQLRLHQREFKMVVPPSKVSNFFQRKEISQKLEAFFHSVSSSHRPFVKFPLKKKILVQFPDLCTGSPQCKLWNGCPQAQGANRQNQVEENSGSMGCPLRPRNHSCRQSRSQMGS